MIGELACTLAKGIGVSDAMAGRPCIPAKSSGLMELMQKHPGWHGDSLPLIQAYIAGVDSVKSLNR